MLPNGPDYHPTVRAFLAGGVPEVMLHLRDLGLLHTDAMTVTGQTVGENLDWWQASERRERFRQCLREQDGVDPDDVILPPEKAKAKGLTSTVCFPTGNIAPEGSVIKATAIDPSVVGEDGVYRHTGRARVFVSEAQAIKAIKREEIKQGDIMVVIGGGRPAPHGRDLPAHLRAEAYLVGQDGVAHHRCALLGRVDGRLLRPRVAGGAGGRADW